METWGWILLIVGALVIGLVAQYLIRRELGYEWIWVSLGAGIAGFVASEYDLVGLGKWGTEYVKYRDLPCSDRGRRRGCDRRAPGLLRRACHCSILT